MRNRVEKLSGVLMLRIGEELLGPCMFNECTVFHHDHFIRDVGDYAHVVGDDEDGDSQFLPQRSEQRQNSRLHGDIESRSGLISDDEFWVADDRHSDHGTLPLTTRKLMWVLSEFCLRFRHLHLQKQLK